MNPVEILDADLRHLTEPADGLAPAIHYVMTFLDAVDGRTRWMPRRAYHPEATRSIYVPEAPWGSDFDLSPDAKRAYAGPVECRTNPARLTVAAPDGSSRLDAADNALTWSEQDLLEISGTSVGPAWRFRLTDPAFPLLYTSRPYRVAGTVREIPVQGAALLVTIHLPEGTDLLASELLSRLQISWTEFVNLHEDGTTESGLLVWGRDGISGMAVNRSDGSSFVTSDVAVVMENDGGVPEFPRQIAFSGDGETLRWSALTAGGRWPTRADIPDGYRFRQGEVHRDGTERAATSYAFAETFQDRM